MRNPSRPEDATLADVLVDGFERNECLGGFHWRDLPMPTEAAAARKFAELAAEATRWKGTPERTEDGDRRRLVGWPDFEIRQVGRGIRVRVEAPRFDSWWQDAATWDGHPMGEMWAWLEEEDDR